MAKTPTPRFCKDCKFRELPKFGPADDPRGWRCLASPCGPKANYYLTGEGPNDGFFACFTVNKDGMCMLYEPKKAKRRQ